MYVDIISFFKILLGYILTEYTTSHFRRIYLIGL